MDAAIRSLNKMTCASHKSARTVGAPEGGEQDDVDYDNDNPY